MPARRGILLIVSLAIASLGAAVDAHAGFDRVPGSSERVGDGERYRFTVAVEDKLGIDRKEFGREVERTLLDDRSWTASGEVSFQRVGRGGDTKVLLASPGTVDRLCSPLPTNGTYSCSQGRKVVINSRRWRHAVSHWSKGLENYRRMVVNHEMGHRIGHGHRDCPRKGKMAPVMQQQSIALQGCDENWWPLRRELRSTGKVAAAASSIDASVCSLE